MTENAPMVPSIATWLPMSTAPRDGKEIIVVLGATIPDGLDVRAASFIDGVAADELGWREYAKYGAWMIWHDAGDWNLVDESAPLGWLPMPKTLPPQPSIIDQFAADAMLAHRVQP